MMDDRLVALPYKDSAMEIKESAHQQTGYRHCFQKVGDIKGHINKDQNWIQLEITRALGRNVNGLAVSTSIPDIHRLAVENFGYHITRAQVYYWRLEVIRLDDGGSKKTYWRTKSTKL
ncbi:hypothetical protein BC941DRAFT_518790 [Chlamydoabsidia padenii]|nr:hypothetical protein BC941DRAFT_518790 [Chlamydoabsidia padenii]